MLIVTALSVVVCLLMLYLSTAYAEVENYLGNNYWIPMIQPIHWAMYVVGVLSSYLLVGWATGELIIDTFSITMR